MNRRDAEARRRGEKDIEIEGFFCVPLRLCVSASLRFIFD